jgi:hypothetical protein
MKYKDFYPSLLLNELLDINENRELHKLYVYIIDIVKDFATKKSKFNPKKTTFLVWFHEIYKPIKPEIHKVAGDSTALYFKLSNEFRKVFPNVGMRWDGNVIFVLEFFAPDESRRFGNLKIRNGEEIIGIDLNLEYVTPENFATCKTIVQHELQHFVTNREILYSDDPPQKNQENDLVQFINYLCAPAEIEAFAKQFAYLYHKKFPDHRKIDQFDLLDYIQSIKDQTFVSHIYSYLLYFKYPHKSEFKKILTPKLAEKMRRVHFDFVRELTRSLNYFIRVDSTKLEESVVLKFPTNITDEEKRKAREALKFYISKNYNYYSNAEQNLKNRYEFKLERIRDDRWSETIYTFGLIGKGGTETQLKSYPDAPYSNAGKRYRTVKDAIESIPHDANSAYRGMSFEELLNAKKLGYFKSKGELNIGASQAGYTFFGENPSTAIFYATGFQPIVTDITRNRPGAIIQVSKDLLSPADITPNKSRTGVVGSHGEWVTSEKIPLSKIENVWFVVPTTSTYATIDVVYNRYNKTYSSGSRYPASKTFAIINKKDFFEK